MIDLEIFGCYFAQRYAIRQTVVEAKRDLQNEYPEMKIVITDLKDWEHIEQ